MAQMFLGTKLKAAGSFDFRAALIPDFAVSLVADLHNPRSSEIAKFMSTFLYNNGLLSMLPRVPRLITTQ
jgi:hypothetical protein